MTRDKAKMLRKGERVYVVEHKVSKEESDVYLPESEVYQFEKLEEGKYGDDKLWMLKNMKPGYCIPIERCRTADEHWQHLKAINATKPIIEQDASMLFEGIDDLFKPTVVEIHEEIVVQDFAEPVKEELISEEDDSVRQEMKEWAEKRQKEKSNNELGGLFSMVGQDGVGITDDYVSPVQKLKEIIDQPVEEPEPYVIPKAVADVIEEAYEPRIKEEQLVMSEFKYLHNGQELTVKVFNGDSVFGEHGITSVPSKSVNLIATDPPFGMEFQSNFRVVKHKKIANDDNLVFLPQFFKEAYRILADNSHMYCFCSWHHVDTFVSEARKVFGKKGLRNILIWEKEHQGMGDLEQLGMSYELIMFLEKGHRQHDYMRDGNILKFVSTKNKLHPTQKPVDLMQFLIYISAKPGDTVADFFSGSGSTGIAGMNEGMNVLMWEMDETHYHTIIERVQRQIKHPELFTSGMFRENKTKVDKYIDAIKKDYEIRLKEREYEERTEIIKAIREHIIDDPSKQDYNKFLIDMLIKLETKDS